MVGAGHAGCEAARACARLGLKTAMITMNLDLIAQMSCNPAVGGIAKGHLVREIDALGGVMGEVTDSVGIQFRLLNTSRGPAVWSPRAQCDKKQYRLRMRETLEKEPNLRILQAEVAQLVLSGVRLPVHPRSCPVRRPNHPQRCCGCDHRHFPEWLSAHWRTTLQLREKWRGSVQAPGRSASRDGARDQTAKDRHAAPAGWPHDRWVKL